MVNPTETNTKLTCPTKSLIASLSLTGKPLLSVEEVRSGGSGRDEDEPVDIDIVTGRLLGKLSHYRYKQRPMPQRESKVLEVISFPNVTHFRHVENKK